MSTAVAAEVAAGLAAAGMAGVGGGGVGAAGMAVALLVVLYGSKASMKQLNRCNHLTIA